jgi:sporulation-control protein spo0M
VPFSFEVPLNTPVTFGRVPVWLKTGLDIDSLRRRARRGEVLVVVDRRVRSFTGLLGAAMDLNERKRPLRFSGAELGHGRQALADRRASIIQVLAG